jgi:CRISPR/Cas system-associated endoribonuclease Cas2
MKSNTGEMYITRIERAGKIKKRCVYYIVRVQESKYQNYLGSFSSLVKAKKALREYNAGKEQQ